MRLTSREKEAKRRAEAEALFPVRGEIRASLREAGIYVIGFSDYLKIGISDCLIDRLIGLQNHLPEQLILYATHRGGRELEGQLHARFREYRTRGEWFKNTGILKEWTDAGCVLPFYRLTTITGGLEKPSIRTVQPSGAARNGR
ncbi:GIY-YIG nuclease family protein [Bradyrhizobium yuanmingense]|uniref:GIY-YIG nuclease family protein n=1 Tax=Bradyrhizobium yuanmingense TaxID=108015 RepID=UPI0004BB8B22|nr:GIY-YIG nuclease family protein [Bradyrhizobium yuanmingense]